MKMDLAGAMRAATKLTRAQKLMEATRVIQSALLLGRGPTDARPRTGCRGAGDRAAHDRHHPKRGNDGGRSAGAGELADGRHCCDARPGETSKLRARWFGARQAAQASRDPRRRSVLEPVLCLRCRKAKLQALRSESSSCRRTPPIDRHAAWRHAGCRRLRGRDPHERIGRGAWISRRLSKPVQERQSIALLELVQA